MVKLSAAIRSKPRWWDKFRVPEIRAKWKEEAVKSKSVWIEAATMLVPFEEHEQFMEEARENICLDDLIVVLSEKQVDYVLDELEGYAELRNDDSGIEVMLSSVRPFRISTTYFLPQVSCFDGVWQSDTLAPAHFKQALIDNVKVLEDVPEDIKDWHPKTGKQVLDLVHPSLYPLIYGRTLARYPDPSQPLATILSPFEVDESEVMTQYQSEKFQWLPTDFSVSKNGEVKALGYINNLHPSHEGLYDRVEDAIKLFVPLWEQVLTDMLHPLPTRITDSYLPIEEVDPNYPKETNFEQQEVRYDSKHSGG